MRASRSQRRLGALATNVEKSGALARPRLCGACGACRREMQVVETQSSHRRHACRERARNAPHLRCKKRGSASAAIIIARHGCRAGATTGRSAMDGYRDVPFTPTCSAYAVQNAVAVMRTLWSLCNGVCAQQGRRYVVHGAIRCKRNGCSPRIHPDSIGFTVIPAVYAPRPPAHPLS